MNNRKKLTPSAIDRLRFDATGPARQVQFDSQLAGFGVRVYASGRKSYVLQYGSRSKRRLMVLAPCTSGKDVDRAREKAQIYLRKHYSDGADPLDEKRKAEAGTVAAIVEDYIDARKGQWSAKEVERSRARLRLHIGPRIGRVQFARLTRREVREMHGAISKTTKYEANRSLGLLRAAFNWALSECGWRAAELAEGENPAMRVKPNKEKRRKEWVRPEEVESVMQAIAGEENPWMQAFFRMVLFTGARKSELLNLRWDIPGRQVATKDRWSHVDLKNAVVRFPDTKNDEDHEIPLPPEAIELLKALPRTLGNPYVFCGRVRGKPINNPYKPWARILERAGIERRVTIHDLRRTVGSLLASSGYSTQMIGKLLNHKSAITAKVYAEIADQAKRELTDAMARMLR